MYANTQPHIAAHKKTSLEAKIHGKPNGSNKPHNFLDSVLGPGVIGWDPVLGEDPTGHATTGSAAGGTIKLDSEQQQQYGIPQVCSVTTVGSDL